MLSKLDIMKSLGKDIAIVPFEESNIKENSINLTASDKAWTLNDGCFNGNKIRQGDSAIVDNNSEKMIVVFPHSTTIIETKEVISVSSKIGGTYHSKVGTACLGIGHIGTMLGPNYSGHSLIPIHNISDKIITIKVNDTFVSVVFYYLQTKANIGNATNNGHLEKFSELKVNITKEDRELLDEGWKHNHKEIIEKMKKDNNYKKYGIMQLYIKPRLNKKTVCFSIVLFLITIILGILAFVYNGFKDVKFVEIYFSVIIGGFWVTVLSNIYKKLF